VLAVEIESTQSVRVGREDEEPCLVSGRRRQAQRQVVGVDADAQGPLDAAGGGTESVQDAARQGEDNLAVIGRLAWPSLDARIEEHRRLEVVAAAGRRTDHSAWRGLDIADTLA